MSNASPATRVSFGTYLLDHLQHAFHNLDALSPQVRLRMPHLISRVVLSHQTRTEILQQRNVRVPTIIFLAVSGQCNLRCPHCYTQSYERNTMPGWLARRIVGQAYALGVSLIVVTGGEPLLHPDFFDIPKDFPDLPFLVFSNGLAIDNFFARRTDYANLLWAISVDGPREYQDSRRGAGTYDGAMHALDVLARQGLPFGFSCTLGEANLPSATSPEFVTMLAAKGCRAGIFLEQMPHPDCEPSLSTQIAGSLAELRERINIPVISFPGDEAMYGGCQAGGHGMIHISPEGRLEPCPAARISAQSLAEVSLEEALTSPFMNTFRELKQQFADCPSGCSSHACSYMEHKDHFQAALAPHGAVAG